MVFRVMLSPPQWLKHLKYPSGKPYMIAAFILSDIVYWYRPVVIRDEVSGQVLGYRKKFASDKLQRNYQAFADMYGFTKREVTDACHYLQDMGLIDLNLRNFTTGLGIKLGNVLFIGLNSEAVKQITVNVIAPTPESDRVLPQDVIAPTPEGETNTEITTEITTESEYTPAKNGNSPIAEPLTDIVKFAKQGVSERTAPNQTAQYMEYTDAFLKLWQNKTGRYPNQDEKDAITKLAEELGGDPTQWELALTECNLHYTGHRLPVARAIEVCSAGGTWAEWCKQQDEEDKPKPKEREPLRDPRTGEIIPNAWYES